MNEFWCDVSQRLKDLRTKKGVSVETLAEDLTERGLKISVSTLKNYESASNDPLNRKAETIIGMRIETLRALAEYYDVSIDYILCRSDIKSLQKDISGSAFTTGLSDATIQKLNYYKDLGTELTDNIIPYSAIIDDVLYHTHFFTALSDLNRACEIASTMWVEDLEDNEDKLSADLAKLVAKGENGDITLSGKYAIRYLAQESADMYKDLFKGIVKTYCIDGKKIEKTYHPLFTTEKEIEE